MQNDTMIIAKYSLVSPCVVKVGSVEDVKDMLSLSEELDLVNEELDLVNFEVVVYWLVVERDEDEDKDWENVKREEWEELEEVTLDVVTVEMERDGEEIV